MAKHTLWIVTYSRGTYYTNEIKPYHWSFFIETETQGIQRLGIAHQIRGMPGAFRYQGPEKVDLKKSQNRKEELEIGEVDDSKLDEIHNILKEVPIDNVESSGWNCQDWALDGMVKLQEKGFVYDFHKKEDVKNWLKERA